MEQRTYTIKEAAAEVGRSVSWVRKQVHKGHLNPERTHGRHGEQYTFTDADIAEARTLVPVRRTKEGTLSEAYSVALRAESVNLALHEQITDLRSQVARLEGERDAQARIVERLEQEQERVRAEAQAEAERLRAERDAESERVREAQERIASLKSLGWWQVLRGKHRSL